MLKMYYNYCPICFNKRNIYNPLLVLNKLLLYECPECKTQIVNLSPYKVHILDRKGEQDFLIENISDEVHLNGLPIALAHAWSPFETIEFVTDPNSISKWFKLPFDNDSNNIVDYKTLINETDTLLFGFKVDLHEKMINLIMQGELREWNEGIEETENLIGEAFCFDDDLIKSINDINVKNLYSLYLKIYETNDTLLNLNPYLTDKFKDDEE